LLESERPPEVSTEALEGVCSQIAGPNEKTILSSTNSLSELATFLTPPSSENAEDIWGWTSWQSLQEDWGNQLWNGNAWVYDNP